MALFFNKVLESDLTYLFNIKYIVKNMNGILYSKMITYAIKHATYQSRPQLFKRWIALPTG